MGLLQKAGENNYYCEWNKKIVLTLIRSAVSFFIESHIVIIQFNYGSTEVICFCTGFLYFVLYQQNDTKVSLALPTKTIQNLIAITWESCPLLFQKTAQSIFDALIFAWKTSVKLCIKNICFEFFIKGTVNWAELAIYKWCGNILRIDHYGPFESAFYDTITSFVFSTITQSALVILVMKKAIEYENEIIFHPFVKKHEKNTVNKF